MTKLDPSHAECAIVVLARTQGQRRAMSLLWEYGARRVCGSLGHHPIMVANTWRTLEALGWQHAEQVLRYLARCFQGTRRTGRTSRTKSVRGRLCRGFLPIGHPTSPVVVPLSRSSISCVREEPMQFATSFAHSFPPDE